ncbi:MAG: GTPase HflX [Desulfobacterales bacterium]|nr:GTPase HflX [Desulfobacterales bacterium]
MKKIWGNTGGLKAGHMRRLEKLYGRRVPGDHLLTFEIAREISELSRELRRQIGLLVNRMGKVAYVIVGDHHKIVIPVTDEYRMAPGRLKGVRCIHTHLNDEPLTEDDCTDLELLRLDIMAAITVSEKGRPDSVFMGHILPETNKGKAYRLLPPADPHHLDINCLEMIQAIEAELAGQTNLRDAGSGKERALLVSVTTASKKEAMDNLDELRELAFSCNIAVSDVIFQKRRKVDSKFLMGLGKLQDLYLKALQDAVSLIIFDQELNPSQIRAITDQVELKVIDRTQLILDIFAQRAHSREGKLQVELAQLKYLLPRLVVKNTAMSRLTGGIGGRGPGETKLEINRRRARDRITRIEKELKRVKKQRKQQKTRREKREIPVVSIVGYTNAGKSTLLNTMTKSSVPAENRLFATLDPSSRRLRFPRDIEVIITDTVGFIKDLPKDLVTAFMATLEELESADILLHVIDISNPRFEKQISSVEKILSDLSLDRIPTIRVLNKQDVVDPETTRALCRRLDGIAVSARKSATLVMLMEKLSNTIGES